MPWSLDLPGPSRRIRVEPLPAHAPAEPAREPSEPREPVPEPQREPAEPARR